MGRKGKKFIDKKKSATFQLLSRDFTDPNFTADAPGGDRIFVRTDNNPVALETFGDDGSDEDPDSIFADAPEDGEGGGGFGGLRGESNGVKRQLPDDVRKEILELGFPDDGYNYLLHMREIRNTGGGSAFYQNPKTRLDLVPKDVKAYDASKVMVPPAVKDEPNDGSIYNVASQSHNVRVMKVYDPEVAALLDDDDRSRFGSDVEDLEEDFIVQANFPDQGDEHAVSGTLGELTISETAKGVADHPGTSVHPEEQAVGGYKDENNNGYANEKQRVRRPLDEQFDLLVSQEYGSDYEDDDYYYGGHDGAEEEDCLADKLIHTLNNKVTDELDIDGDYKAPADLLRDKDQLQSKELEDAATVLIDRCREYAEKYEKEDEEDREMIIVEESSDESEVWDCETIVSTYSNLDNHPQKIEAPGVARRRLLSKTVVAGALAANNQVISLKGKERLPVDFLPHGKRPAVEKAKGGDALKPEQPKTRQHGQESKEEKKERKSAVKEERREARRMKKEMKGLYRCETHRAQRVAAVTGPSSIPLM